MSTTFYYLYKEEIEYIIDKILNKESEEQNDYLDKVFEDAISWEIEFVFLNYFFCRMTDKKVKFNNEIAKQYKNEYFSLIDKVGSNYEDFKRDFIKSLFDEEQSESLSLEENLLEVTKIIYNKRY